jgi:uncharacterized protein YwbE
MDQRRSQQVIDELEQDFETQQKKQGEHMNTVCLEIPKKKLKLIAVGDEVDCFTTKDDLKTKKFFSGTVAEVLACYPSIYRAIVRLSDGKTGCTNLYKERFTNDLQKT